MNDQWSGNTLLSAVRTNPAAPKRWSSQSSFRRLLMSGTPRAPGSPVAVPEPRPDRTREVAPGDELAVLVAAQGQLGQRAGRRPKDGPGSVEDVEGRLVAGAQQQAGFGLV